MTDCLYLPLVSSTADALEQGQTLPAELGIAQQATVALVQLLAPKIGSNLLALERSLAELIEAGMEDPQAFARQVADRFDAKAFARGRACLDAQVLWLEETEVESAAYLDGRGLWRIGFAAEHDGNLTPLQATHVEYHGRPLYLSSPQARLFETLRLEPDEPMHVQALAGTGKTFLIETLLHHLEGYRPLVLAFTAGQVEALRSRLGTAMHDAMTFGQLADRLLAQDLTRRQRQRNWRDKPSYQMSDSEIARRLGITDVGGVNAALVARLCRRAVMSFCASPAQELGDQHLPLFDRPFDATARAVLVEHSRRLWWQTVEPTETGLDLPRRGYHRIKHLSLLPELVLERQFSHVIIDESHDLSAPMMQFLDRCPQPSYTFGDRLQRLDGHSAQRSERVREREIFQSIRAGKGAEAVVNPLIEAHPGAAVGPLLGNGKRDTHIDWYDRPQLPEVPAVLLVESEWGLLEWFQRLSQEAGSRGFGFLRPDVELSFRRFVGSCIELYQHGTAPTHSALHRYSSWDSLAREHGNRQAFRLIERMLEKGYGSRQFEEALGRLDRSGQATLKLATVKDARNLETDTVMLTPDLLPDQLGTPRQATEAFARLYTGASRARYRLIVPGYLKDWIADHRTR